MPPKQGSLLSHAPIENAKEKHCRRQAADQTCRPNKALCSDLKNFLLERLSFSHDRAHYASTYNRLVRWVLVEAAQAVCAAMKGSESCMKDMQVGCQRAVAAVAHEMLRIIYYVEHLQCFLSAFSIGTRAV